MPALAVGCLRPARLAADLVITNAIVWTGDARQPDATAVAIIGDRIVDVGSSTDIDRWRGPATTVVDAEGRRVLPGFNDAHVHLIDGGTALDNVNLKDAETPAEFARRIGISVATVRGWEQGRLVPHDAARAVARGPARAYLAGGLNPGMPGNSVSACLAICSCICVNILRDCSR